MTHDLVRVFDTKTGFCFVINEAGKRLVNALESRYAIEYSAAVQAAEQKYSAKTDEELMVMVQEQWQLQEEANR